MRYDLLVIDLDGTLLSPGGAVSHRNQRSLEAARAAGLQVVIATGRAYPEACRFLQTIGHEGMLVAAGGSLLTDVDGRTLIRHALPADVVSDITELFVDHGHKALILKDSTATGYDYLAIGPHDMHAASAWWFDKHSVDLRYLDRVDDDEHPHDTVRAGIVGAEQDMEILADAVNAMVGDRVSFQHWSAVTSEKVNGEPTHLLEAFRPSVNKWTMIEAVCARSGIDSDRVAAIGDGLNDVELIEGAALGVAMANADPRVAAVADRHTAHHTDDGVALAIEHILEGAW
jgi:hypothetical protein